MHFLQITNLFLIQIKHMKILALSFATAEENLAFEEWYFEHFEEETLRIWRSPKSVVVGKHQNALAEVDLNFCLENKIPVLRRISGGGTVYHDLGNINFSFFRFVEKEKMIDYVRNLDIIKETLIKLSYDVHMSARHDLFLGETKISGNAQHVKRGRALHHGTLLYDADLSALSNGIKRQKGAFVDRSVKSVRSPIANLRQHNNLGNTEEFQTRLISQLSASFGFKILDFEKTPDLDVEKYHKNEWNFGYSPNYTFEKTEGDWYAKLTIERGGIIIDAAISKNGILRTELNEWLHGQLHFHKELSTELEISDFKQLSKEILDLLF